ncbi:MAG: YceI family protein [Chloroflexi bacterium]|nr:YceI family protein [Chloroflexota bacterium]
MSWIIDSAHTEVNFTVRHMMISNVRGQFQKLNGTVEFDEANPANSKVNVQIEAASVNTKDEKRDGHLKSPDFFDAEKYPYLTFKSKRVEVKGANRARLIGDLTIRDVTKEVSLDVEYNGLAKSPWGTTNAGFSAKTSIKRKEWNLNWNVALETGGWLVGDDINITIELELVQQPEAAPAAAVAA